MEYTQYYEGDVVFPRMSGFRQQCCDCGLVHVVKIRKLKRGVELEYKRDERETKAARRKRGVKVVKRKK